MQDQTEDLINLHIAAIVNAAIAVNKSGTIMELEDNIDRIVAKLTANGYTPQQTTAKKKAEKAPRVVDPLKKEYEQMEKSTANIIDFINKRKPEFAEPYFDAWNHFAAKYGCAQSQKITKQREDKLASRVREKQFDFIAILSAASKQPFAYTSSWFTFDFLIRNDNNYIKVLEKHYVTKEAAKEQEDTLKGVKYDNE